MSNPFANWTPEMVAARNRSIIERRRGLIPIPAKTNEQNTTGGSAQGSIPECAVRNEPVAKKAGKDSYPKGYVVSIESRRIRLIDPDNLIGKFFIDSLRYAGLIHGDSAKEIEFQIRQTKVKLPCEEATVIEIEEKP